LQLRLFFYENMLWMHAPGAGATTALTLAGFLARQKYKTVYVERGEPSIEDITGMEVSEKPVSWFRIFIYVGMKI